MAGADTKASKFFINCLGRVGLGSFFVVDTVIFFPGALDSSSCELSCLPWLMTWRRCDCTLQARRHQKVQALQACMA